MLEIKLISEVLNLLKSKEDVDANILKLALNINLNIELAEKTNIYNPFWRVKEIDIATISSVIRTGITILKKKCWIK